MIDMHLVNARIKSAENIHFNRIPDHDAFLGKAPVFEQYTLCQWAETVRIAKVSSGMSSGTSVGPVRGIHSRAKEP